MGLGGVFFIYIVFFLYASLLEDPDTDVLMKALGLMRNLLSGREVRPFE